MSTNYDEDEQVSNAEGEHHNAHVVSSTDKSGDGYVVVSRTEDQKHTHRIDDSDDSLSSSGPEVRSFFFYFKTTIFSRERERETMS